MENIYIKFEEWNQASLNDACAIMEELGYKKWNNSNALDFEWFGILVWHGFSGDYNTDNSNEEAVIENWYKLYKDLTIKSSLKEDHPFAFLEITDKEHFKKQFKKTLDDMYAIMEKKNSDYTKTDPFWNFKLVETLGVTTVEKWILVRMADKMSRISTLIDQDALVIDEAISDTLIDLANYSVILKLYLESKK